MATSLARAEEIYAEVPDPRIRGLAFDTMADRFLATGDHGSAVTLARRATNVATDIGDPRVFVQARTTQALIYLAHDDFRQARRELDIAVRRRSSGDSLVVLALHALVLNRMEEPAAPETFAQLRREAVERRNPARGGEDADFGAWDFEGFAICGLFLHGQADLADAIVAFGRARAICCPPGLLDRLRMLLGKLDKDGRLRTAIVVAAPG